MKLCQNCTIPTDIFLGKKVYGFFFSLMKVKKNDQKLMTEVIGNILYCLIEKMQWKKKKKQKNDGKKVF